MDGELYTEFNGACIALELCEDASQSMEAMVDAVLISHPFVIKELFHDILLHYSPADPRSFFDQLSNSTKEAFVQCRLRGLTLSDNQVATIN